jgi:hypothetical protein
VVDLVSEENRKKKGWCVRKKKCHACHVKTNLWWDEGFYETTNIKK